MSGSYMTIWLQHGGIWRTMHCRLCINWYRTGWVSVCVCNGGEAVGVIIPSPPPSRFRNNLCKDDSEFFSRFLHGIRYLHRMRCRFSWKVGKSAEQDELIRTWYLLNVCKKSRKIFVSLLKNIREDTIRVTIRQTGTLRYKSSSAAQVGNNISDPSEISTVCLKRSFFQKAAT